MSNVADILRQRCLRMDLALEDLGVDHRDMGRVLFRDVAEFLDGLARTQNVTELEPEALEAIALVKAAFDELRLCRTQRDRALAVCLDYVDDASLARECATRVFEALRQQP